LFFQAAVFVRCESREIGQQVGATLTSLHSRFCSTHLKNFDHRNGDDQNYRKRVRDRLHSSELHNFWLHIDFWIDENGCFDSNMSRPMRINNRFLSCRDVTDIIVTISAPSRRPEAVIVYFNHPQVGTQQQ
jgi:hypothetical protein